MRNVYLLSGRGSTQLMILLPSCKALTCGTTLPTGAGLGKDSTTICGGASEWLRLQAMFKIGIAVTQIKDTGLTRAAFKLSAFLFMNNSRDEKRNNMSCWKHLFCTSTVRDAKKTITKKM
jgi:hypothetical protein